MRRSHRYRSQGLVVTLIVILVAFGPHMIVIGQDVATVEVGTEELEAPQEPPIAPSSITFNVGVCPPGVTEFPSLMQADGLPDCEGTGLVGGETPLGGGTVLLVNLDTGEPQVFTLDGSGYGTTSVTGGSMFAASFELDGVPLQSRSVCGSSLGLAGAIESGIFVSEGDDLSCQVLTLSLEPAPAPTRTGGTIELSLRYCPDETDVSTLLVGDGILDCNGDPEIDESEPYAGATVSITNLTSGEVFTDVTNDAGVFASGTIPTGPYVAVVFVDGEELEWASVCGGTDASGAPLGLVGPLDNAAAPVGLADGDSLDCDGLLIVPTIPVPPPPTETASIVLALEVRDCPDNFDWEPVVTAGAPTDASIQAVHDHYAASCTEEGSLPVTMSWRDIVTGEEGPSTEVMLASTFETEAVPGRRFTFKHDDATVDFWADCESDAVYDRSGANHLDPIVSPAVFSLTVPNDIAENEISCTIYLNHAAGTITHVVHGCDGYTFDGSALACIPAPLPPQQFDEGAIWTSLPADTSAWDDQTLVYAGPRWYLRNGFNRPWTTGITDDGSLTLEGSVPLTTVEIGVGNVDEYQDDVISIYCGSESTGWTWYPVLPIGDTSPAIQWGDSLVPIGIGGAPAHVTCHWFVDVARLGSP